MPLTGIRGKGGSGKNTYFAYHVYRNKKLLKDIDKITNFDFLAPKIQKFDTVKLLEMEDLTDEDKLYICAIDEAYVEFDCRNSMDLLNKLNSILLFQARKNNMSMVGISQLNVMDIRWRELEEKLVYCFDRPILDKHLKPFKGDFHYALVSAYRKPVKLTLRYHTAKKVFRFFKTKQKILPHDIEDLKMRLNLRNAKNRKEVVIKLVKEVMDNYPDLEKNIVTHDWLKNAFLDLDIPEAAYSLEKYVYIRLKAKLK